MKRERVTDFAELFRNFFLVPSQENIYNEDGDSKNIVFDEVEEKAFKEALKNIDVLELGLEDGAKAEKEEKKKRKIREANLNRVNTQARIQRPIPNREQNEKQNFERVDD